MHRCDCWSGKTAVVALEISSCHSRKLCDKAGACDHFLSVYFWDLRQKVLYSIFTHVSARFIFLQLFLYFFPVRSCIVHNCCLFPQTEGEKEWEIRGDISIHLYWYDISLDLVLLNCFGLSALARSAFNNCTGSSSIPAGLGLKNSEGLQQLIQDVFRDLPRCSCRRSSTAATR